MASAKVTTWNIENMHDWFAEPRGHVVPEFQDMAQKVGRVIKTIRPHILCVQEGPRLESQMRSFLDEFVEGDWEVFGSETVARQRSYVAYRDFPGLEQVDEVDFIATAWKYPFLKHSETTGTYSHVNQKFTRLPVEMIFHTSRGAFSVVCLHLKSKISFYANYATSSDPKKRTLGIAEGLEQRARILQEARLLREYFLDHPFASVVRGRTLVVGDMNDGPGTGFFEKRFFGTDLMRRIRGDIDHPERVFADVLDRGPQSKRFSAIFYDRLDGELRSLLLDHILVPPQFLSSDGLRVDRQSGRVEHNAYLAENTGDWTKTGKPDRQTYPSDHRPASVVVRF